jgi:hypothetical protein
VGRFTIKDVKRILFSGAKVQMMEAVDSKLVSVPKVAFSFYSGFENHDIRSVIKRVYMREFRRLYGNLWEGLKRHRLSGGGPGGAMTSELPGAEKRGKAVAGRVHPRSHSVLMTGTQMVPETDPPENAPLDAAEVLVEV